MPEVTVSASALVDIASKDDLARHHDRIAGLLTRPHARFHKARGMAPSTATPVVLDCGRPAMGMVWSPQFALVWGNDAFTNVANVSWVLFCGSVPSASALTVGPPVTGLDGADPILTGGNSGISVPSYQSIADRMVVYGQENLFAVVSGSGLVAGARAYKLVVGVIEVPDTFPAILWP